MPVAFGVLSLLCGYAQALTIPTSAIQPSIQCIQTGQVRTAWDIIRSCSTTIFACVWIAIHIDVPDRNGRWWMPVRRRAESMFFALLAPEILVSWAFRQRREAKRLVGLKYHKWTMTAGFFAVMGGFTDIQGNTILSQEFGSINVQITIREDEIDDTKVDSSVTIREGKTNGTNVTSKITIHGDEIDDKSKGDIVVKGLALVQTSWFIIQCIARLTQGLAITELEIVTAAFATLNFATYVLWWSKPIDVRCPIRIAVPPRPPSTTMFNSSCGNNRYNLPRDAPIFLNWLGQMTFGGQAQQGKRTRELPLWYGGEPKNQSRKEAACVAALAGIIFGVIHCAGWLGLFSTRAEQMLWRVSSLVITCLPCILSMFFLLDISPLLDRGGADGLAWMMNILDATYHLLSALYVLSRLLLLVLPFVALRHLDPKERCAIRWSALIPHV